MHLSFHNSHALSRQDDDTARHVIHYRMYMKQSSHILHLAPLSCLVWCLVDLEAGSRGLGPVAWPYQYNCSLCARSGWTH